MSLLRKVVIVTGASRGIGKKTAIMFSKKGAVVIGTATTEEGVKKINSYLTNRSGKGFILDVTDVYSIDIFVKTVLKAFSCIDILVNNVGVADDDLTCNITPFKWEKVLSTNLSSVFYVSKAVIPSMMKRKYGRIITVGSVVGFLGNIGQVNYSSSKSGLIGLNKSMALELALRNITVNIVSPGYIHTDMTKCLKNKSRKILSKIPMRKFGTTTDVSNAILFLSSDKANYITGQTLHINGGMYMN